MEITVRRAEERDIPRIEALLIQVCNVHAEGRPDLFKKNEQKYHEQELRELLKDPDKPIFVGVDEEDRVQGYGFCVLSDTTGSSNLQEMKSLYIDDLCVDAEARGSGVGRKIYESIEQYARELGCYHLTLNVWSCNPTALSFYESRGLKEMKKTMEVIL